MVPRKLAGGTWRGGDSGRRCCPGSCVSMWMDVSPLQRCDLGSRADWPCTLGLSWGREDTSERHTGVQGPPSAAKGRGPSEPTSSLKVIGDQSQ